MSLEFKTLDTYESKIFYLDKISILHQKNLKGSIAYFGFDFIRRLYRIILTNNSVFLIICYDNSNKYNLLGYILFSKKK